MVKKDWIGKVDKKMEKRGTEGAFTKDAKRHKMSVKAYADFIIKKYKGKKGLNLKQKRISDLISENA